MNGKVMKDSDVLIRGMTSFRDQDSAQYIDPDHFQHLRFPKEYPAMITIHKEYPAQSVPLHHHPSSELIYNRNKELTVSIDGKKYMIGENDFILISSYAFHSIEPCNDYGPQDALSISFETAYLERMIPDIRKMKVSRYSKNASEASIENMKYLCERLYDNLLFNKDKNQTLETNQLLFKILDLMYTEFLVEEENDKEETVNKYDKIVRVLTYIEEHYHEHLSTQDMADLTGYSREYFCRLFKKYFKQGFQQYLTNYRLDRAEELLTDGDRTIAQIIMETGFADEKSFFKAFREKYGMTPMQYKKIHQE